MTGAAHFKRKPGPGRPKGIPNKTTQMAKEAIAEAFERMGGVKSLVAWAKKNDDNRRVFYSMIWPKIVPLTVGSDPNNPVRVTLVELVAPAMKNVSEVGDVELIEHRESTH